MVWSLCEAAMCVCGVGMQGNQKQGVLCIVWQVKGSSTCTDTLVRGLCEAAMCVGWGCRVIKNRVYCVAGSGQQHVHRHTGAELV